MRKLVNLEINEKSWFEKVKKTFQTALLLHKFQVFLNIAEQSNKTNSMGLLVKLEENTKREHK